MPVETSILLGGSHCDEEPRGGCAFILGGTTGGPGMVTFCNVPSQPGSAYCPRHHAFCHLPNGSTAEWRQLSEIEALAEAIGGKRGRTLRHPPTRLLRRLDRVARTSLLAKNAPLGFVVLEDADGRTSDR